MHYIIYCDESEKRGKYFSNFYGGALENKKTSLNLNNEVKWSRVTQNYLDKYKELINLFFSFVSRNQIKIRIMFTHNYLPATKLTQEQKDDEFYILYYQFLRMLLVFNTATKRENQ